MTRDASSHSFLGEEFLTWLWFRMEASDAGGEFEIGDGRTVGVVLDDFLVFAALDDDETEQTLRRGLPSHSPEANAALRNGRRLRRAKLVIADGPAQFGVTIDGTTMQLSGIKLPEDSEECENQQERNVERAAGFMALQELVDGLYARFLQDRLRPDYSSTSGEQQAQWMASR